MIVFKINSLALNNNFSYGNVFQIGVNSLSKMVIEKKKNPFFFFFFFFFVKKLKLSCSLRQYDFVQISH